MLISFANPRLGVFFLTGNYSYKQTPALSIMEVSYSELRAEAEGYVVYNV